jgi:hypothetical protein
MSRLVVLGTLALTLAAHQANAQALPREYTQFMPKEQQELMTAMAAAQVKSIRPGDEALSCPAIEKELVGSMNDPALQAYAARAAGLPPATRTAPAEATAAATAQGAAALLGMLGAGGPPGMPGPGAGLPVVPGGVPLNAVQQAQAAQQQALALQALQDPAAQLKLMVPILPQMMRAQRLVGLAVARSCPWMLGAYGVAVPPAAR